MDHISIELTPKSKLISNHHGFRIPHIEEEVAIKLRDDISKLARLKGLDER
ncbi:hypothetical protein GS8_1541 [Geobacillus stearothermophilus]|uniref:Uncharacterized protein n=1 Tax=Geobacillus stearothermophilus TaxID=1422 RepID=A0ABQ7HF97_GEOSE|nr:hypothetical protein GS8_1541 [Geobacillus stearothermophilus]